MIRRAWSAVLDWLLFPKCPECYERWPAESLETHIHTQHAGDWRGSRGRAA